MKSMQKFLWLFLCLTLLTVQPVWGQTPDTSIKPVESGAAVQTQAEKEPAEIKPGDAGVKAQPQPEKKSTDAKTGDKKDDPHGVILLYALILALFIAVPTIIDIVMAYYCRKRSWELLIDKAAQDNLDKEELYALIKATSVGPPGISGMSRSLMAYGVILIMGIAMFHLLSYCRDKDSLPIINNVLSMLAATLASITGFYFGGRSAEEKSKEPVEKKKPLPPQGPQGPQTTP